MKPIVGPTHIRFDQMTWPKPLPDLEWVLRYGTPTKTELLNAASILAAYKALLFKSQKDRNHICKVLKENS